MRQRQRTGRVAPVVVFVRAVAGWGESAATMENVVENDAAPSSRSPSTAGAGAVGQAPKERLRG